MPGPTGQPPQILLIYGATKKVTGGAVKLVAGGTFPVGSAIILTPSQPKLVGIEPMDATATAWGQTNSGPIRLWVQAGTIQMYVPTGGAVNYVGLAALSGTVLAAS